MCTYYYILQRSCYNHTFSDENFCLFQSEKSFELQLTVCFCSHLIVPAQERTGVQMIMIQDDPMPTGADKPLRITGDPQKVQVGHKKAQCVSPSFKFTLNFTHFMPPVFYSNLKSSVFTDRIVCTCCSSSSEFFVEMHHIHKEFLKNVLIFFLFLIASP